MENCICSRPLQPAGEGELEAFAAVRAGCPALCRVFVPDGDWLRFQEWHSKPDGVAHHRSSLLLAMERGHLARVTSAVHRYLIADGLPRPDIRQQYLQDLRERWMLCSEPSERHEKARMFSGRLVELQFAEWLETQGWTVSGLEALQKGPDVKACARDGRTTAFEVKFIGTENDDFGGILKSLAGKPAAQSMSPYNAANYLLFRVYEAAKQLQRFAYDRIAVVVVEELTWFRFNMQISNGWIDWDTPRFFSGHDGERFLAGQRTRYPTLPGDLEPALRSLDAVWILRRAGDYQYHSECEVRLGRT